MTCRKHVIASLSIEKFKQNPVFEASPHIALYTLELLISCYCPHHPKTEFSGFLKPALWVTSSPFRPICSHCGTKEEVCLACQFATNILKPNFLSGRSHQTEQQTDKQSASGFARSYSWLLTVRRLQLHRRHDAPMLPRIPAIKAGRCPACLPPGGAFYGALLTGTTSSDLILIMMIIKV